ncbi:molybdenum cofactor biosynthesis protein [Paenibacillus wulumuqiensis]|uniref:molybdenum cofactor biosynthesis protein n=1 Tax=Paenibacillus wulumuqiensis TaxID=1567107 RepID=UPI000619C8A1|nr:molybdenum cofactor biosynthesis protein MoaE [Paenibacillus wulumuqiensis]
MQYTIKLFAGLAEKIGESQITVEVPPASDTDTTQGSTSVTVQQLKDILSTLYPDAENFIRHSFAAVNQEYATVDTIIKESDELALIPPVSGGSGPTTSEQTPDGLYVITSDPLSAEEVIAKVTDNNHGATIAFIGTTREMTGEMQTVYLEYEAYIPMALSQLQRIGSHISVTWPGARCAISHRIGSVGIAETSVIIAVSSAHRDDAYAASRFAIERLKETVPIWKKEVWADGSEWKGVQTGPWNPIQPKS